MIRKELFETIVNFQNAIDKNKVPDFFKNVHRAEQVLRILKCEFHDFYQRESRRAARDSEERDKWERFWDYPEVKKEKQYYDAVN